jgi:hypothetical protein
VTGLGLLPALSRHLLRNVNNRTHCEISGKVCRNHQNCHYSIYEEQNKKEAYFALCIFKFKKKEKKLIKKRKTIYL